MYFLPAFYHNKKLLFLVFRIITLCIYVPAIVSNTSSMPEVGGEAALLVDPKDHLDIAARWSNCIRTRCSVTGASRESMTYCQDDLKR